MDNKKNSLHYFHINYIWSLVFYLIVLSHYFHFSLVLANKGGICWSKRTNLGENDFVPECTEDGNFKPVQCDNKTGYCFCVDPVTGRPNSQTTTRNRSPNCNRKQQNQQGYLLQNIQRDQQKHHSIASSLSSLIPLIPNKNKRAKRCSTGQRFSYINQLIVKIQNSYQNRRNQLISNIQQYPLGIPIGIRKPVVDSNNNPGYNPLIRKFNDFDYNKDVYLSADELKLLINDINARSDGSKPSQLIACVNSMFDFCDRDHDFRITLVEFLHCLNLRHTQTLNESYLLRRKQQRRGKLNKQTKPNNRHKSDQLENLSMDSDSSSSLSLSSFYSSTGSILLSESLADDQPRNQKNESRLDCLVIQSNLIESTRVKPYSLVFVPECTADGYYVRIQCHLMHCWCVSRVTGQPIKQLNKNTTDNLEACDLMRKGCDLRRRNKFHTQLRQRLSGQGFNCDSIYDYIDISPTDHSIDDQEFQHFMKQWNQRLTINTRLRKCFRTEVHYCDQNDDGRLTRHEWIKCCHDNMTVTNTLMSSSSSSNINHLFNSASSSRLALSHLDSGLFSGSTYSSSIAEAYNQKKNRPRLGPNPLKILNSE